MPLPCDDDLHQHTTYRTSLSLLLSYQTDPKVAWLASLLPPSPLHTPPRIRSTADCPDVLQGDMDDVNKQYAARLQEFQAGTFCHRVPLPDAGR